MGRDEDLISSVDYSEGQKRAAHRVLVELVNIFQEYEEEIRVVVDGISYDEDGIEMTKRDAYEQVQALLSLI